MTDKNTGGPAFPVSDVMALEPRTTAEMVSLAHGMTLRDYFAANAPITMSEAELAIKAVGGSNYTGEQIMKVLCELRWLYADSMLEARND